MTWQCRVIGHVYVRGCQPYLGHEAAHAAGQCVALTGRQSASVGRPGVPEPTCIITARCERCGEFRAGYMAERILGLT